MSSLFRIVDHVVPCQHIRGYPHSTLDSQDDVLHLAVKQYIPVNNPDPTPGDVTVIGAHANGFPKELYEPLWNELIQLSEHSGFRVRSIWIADVAHQGWSAVLNEGQLGNDPAWLDHSRDLLNVINMFRNEMPRPIVGVGHSMGGCQLTNLAIIHPRLFETLVLIDPVIAATASVRGNWLPAMSSATRRDRWPSREDAFTAFKRNKFYQTWDPRVLDLWVKYGLRDLPTRLHPDVQTKQPKEVTLTTTRYQEVTTFLRPTPQTSPPSVLDTKAIHPDFDPEVNGSNSPFYRSESIQTFHNLPFLRPSVLYIFGETSDLSTPDARQRKMDTTGYGLGGSGGAKAGRVKEVVMKDTGHLIPMEKVEETGKLASEWLGQEMVRWRRHEEIMKTEWARVSEREKYTIGDKVLKVLEAARPKKNAAGKAEALEIPKL